MSVSWAADEDGVEHPSLSTEGPDTQSRLAIKAKNFTKARVTMATTTLLVELETMLQTLPPLPPLHWISMRLLYRNHTPSDYEPEERTSQHLSRHPRAASMPPPRPHCAPNS